MILEEMFCSYTVQEKYLRSFFFAARAKEKTLYGFDEVVLLFHSQSCINLNLNEDMKNIEHLLYKVSCANGAMPFVSRVP